MRGIELRFKEMFLYCVIGLLLSSCARDQIDTNVALDFQLENQISRTAPTGELDYYVIPNEKDLAAIPQDPMNPLTPDKTALGKFLFFETAFGVDSEHASGQGTYSCASCHIPEKGFRPDNVQGIADGGVGFGDDRAINPDYLEEELDVQEARPLNLINVAFVTNTAWNGQFGSNGANEGTESVWSQSEATERNSLGLAGLETQNIQGLITHRINYNKDLIDQFGYTDLFDASFSEYEDEDERYSSFTASLAISAYLRTVLSTGAPFQNWLRGESTAMTEEEKKGALLFFGKANCSNCHYEPNLGSREFHALGVYDMDQHPESVKADNPIAKRNLGRGGFTLDQADYYKFKVPGIYNIGDSDFFFHGSSARTLEELIDYKNLAIKENERVTDDHMSRKFVPLGLSDEEKNQLIAFIENGLKDPNIIRLQPEYVLSGNCFPNNDDESKNYLNCD